MAALPRIRDDGLQEYYELTPDGFRYARRSTTRPPASARHGDATSAPSDVKARYGTTHGFGFKEGDVAGIISVRLPARSFWQVAVIIVGGWQLAMILGAFLIAMLFVRFAAIVNPVERLTKATHQISLAQSADLGVAGIGRSSRNELHQARHRHRPPAPEHHHRHAQAGEEADAEGRRGAAGGRRDRPGSP